MTQETMDVLLRFSSTLRSLFLSHGIYEHDAPEALDISALQQLVRLSRLTRFEMQVNLYEPTRLQLSSATLEELLLSGKNIRLRDFQCPALRSLVIDSGYAALENPPETTAAIVATCPLLREGGLRYAKEGYKYATLSAWRSMHGGHSVDEDSAIDDSEDAH
jgi:hypothetical protein